MRSRKTTQSTPKKPGVASLPRSGSKLSKLLTLIQRSHGATVEELVKATGWQKHTVRGAIAGAVKKKLRQRVKVIIDGDRRAYTIVRPGRNEPAGVDRTEKPSKTLAPEPAAP